VKLAKESNLGERNNKIIYPWKAHELALFKFAQICQKEKISVILLSGCLFMLAHNYRLTTSKV